MDSDTKSISHTQYQIRQEGRPKYLAPSISPHVFKISNACSWGLWAFYICFQFIIISLNFNILTYWPMYASILAEILIVLPEMLFLLGTTFTIWKLPKTSEARKSYLLHGDTVPSLDIFVTCAGESVNTVIDTVKAAITQDYPATRFRVLLLDDGRNPSLQQAITRLSHELTKKRGPIVQYLARPPDNHEFGKAGNLQYGLDETKKQSNSEFIASLDADMIVEPDWLRRLVPHAILDETVGLVNPPQVSYIDAESYRCECAHPIRSITIPQKGIPLGVK